MGSMSIWHWLIILLVVVLLFGSGKIKSLFGEFGKGITAFKKGLKEGDEEAKAETSASAPAQQVTAGAPSSSASSAEIKRDAKV
jgi:sec-independent protein translocase protein TatA